MSERKAREGRKVSIDARRQMREFERAAALAEATGMARVRERLALRRLVLAWIGLTLFALVLAVLLRALIASLAT